MSIRQKAIRLGRIGFVLTTCAVVLATISAMEGAVFLFCVNVVLFVILSYLTIVNYRIAKGV